MPQPFSPVPFANRLVLADGTVVHAVHFAWMLAYLRFWLLRKTDQWQLMKGTRTYMVLWRDLCVFTKCAHASLAHGSEPFLSDEPWVVYFPETRLGTMQFVGSSVRITLDPMFVAVVRHIVHLNPTFVDTFVNLLVAYECNPRYWISLPHATDHNAAQVSVQEFQTMMDEGVTLQDAIERAWSAFDMGELAIRHTGAATTMSQ